MRPRSVIPPELLSIDHIPIGNVIKKLQITTIGERLLTKMVERVLDWIANNLIVDLMMILFFCILLMFLFFREELYMDLYRLYRFIFWGRYP